MTSMADLNDELFEKIQNQFNKNIANDIHVKKFNELLAAGEASQIDLMNYSRRLGENLSKSFVSVFGSAQLPDEKITYEIANATIKPMTKNAHAIFNRQAKATQKKLDEAQNIGLNAVEAKYSDRRINGIVSKILQPQITTWDEQKKFLDEPIVNICMNFYDDFIHENADFRFRAGMKPKIIRTSEIKCCEWCSKNAGTYDYEDVSDSGNNVFRRHQRCRCSVVFDSGGTAQNVWTKVVYKSSAAVLRQREQAGL